MFKSKKEFFREYLDGEMRKRMALYDQANLLKNEKYKHMHLEIHDNLKQVRKKIDELYY